MIEIRPAISNDIEELYGEKSPKSLKAKAIYKDNELAALAGLIIADNSCMAFCKIKDRESRNKVTIWRHARAIIRDIISSTPAPVYAGAEPDIPNSGKFLERLGFRRVGEDSGIGIYLYDIKG